MKIEKGPVYDRRYVAAQKAEREATDQFRNLPSEIQDEYRERWQADVDRQVGRELLKEELRCQTIVSCVGLFVVVTALWDLGSPSMLVMAAVVGALTGWLWHVLDAGRFLCIASVVPGYLALRLMGPAQSPYSVFFGAVAIVALAAFLGVLREVRTGNVSPTLLKRVRERRLKSERSDPAREPVLEPVRQPTAERDAEPITDPVATSRSIF